jgi:serine/threonine protein kinase
MDELPHDVLAEGTELGPYVIETRLGAGGMGEVYRARDKRLRRTVANSVRKFWLTTFTRHCK